MITDSADAMFTWVLTHGNALNIKTGYKYDFITFYDFDVSDFILFFLKNLGPITCFYFMVYQKLNQVQKSKPTTKKCSYFLDYQK